MERWNLSEHRLYLNDICIYIDIASEYLNSNSCQKYLNRKLVILRIDIILLSINHFKKFGHQSSCTKSNKNVKNIWVLKNFQIKGSFYFLTRSISLIISSDIIVAASWLFALLLHLNFCLTFYINLGLGMTSTSSYFIKTFTEDINNIDNYFYCLVETMLYSTPSFFFFYLKKVIPSLSMLLKNPVSILRSFSDFTFLCYFLLSIIVAYYPI